MVQLRPILIAIPLAAILLGERASTSHADPYFVGVWVFDRDTCKNGAPPSLTGDSFQDIGEYIRVTKYRFLTNGKFSVEVAGQKQGTAQWSFSGSTLTTIQDGSDDRFHVLSMGPNQFVASENNRDPMTWFRCQ